MIEINGSYISAEVEDIIIELKHQLELNGIKKFYKITDTPNNTMICCPFHKNGQERKPSMGIYKKDGTCHCFTCGWVGSLSEMISNCFGYDDMGLFGNKWLIRNFLTLQVEERKDIELDIVRTRGNNRFIEGDKRFVSEEELDKYRWTHPYWAKRGITDERIIELFDLGYDKDTNCITFPLRDKKGNCLFVARRSVCTKYFHYPEGVEKPVYAEYELYQLQEFPRTVYITESMIDCLTLWQIGKYACALNGLGTVLQIEQLNKMPCRHFVLATDNDEAGMRARKNLAQKLKNKIITQVIFPENRKDINECTENELLNLKEVFV